MKVAQTATRQCRDQYYKYQEYRLPSMRLPLIPIFFRLYPLFFLCCTTRIQYENCPRLQQNSSKTIDCCTVIQEYRTRESHTRQYLFIYSLSSFLVPLFFFWGGGSGLKSRSSWHCLPKSGGDLPEYNIGIKTPAAVKTI